MQNLTIGGKRTMRGLGRFPATSLDAARKLAKANWQDAQPAKAPNGADAIAQAVASAVAPMLQAQTAMLSELQALHQTVQDQSALLASLATKERSDDDA